MLYKYKPIDRRALEILINGEIYFPLSSSFNDPFDGCLLPEDFVTEVRDLGYDISGDDISRHNDYVKERLQGCGILSLSQKPDDLLMWSHYAESHKGICFEFEDDLKRSIFSDCPVDFYHISYSESHPFKAVMDDLQSGKRFNSDDGFLNLWQMASALMLASITVKHKSWEYEEECRIVVERYGLYEFDPKCLKSIIFGLKSSVGDRKVVSSLIKNPKWTHVELKEIKRGRGALDLKIDPYG